MMERDRQENGVVRRWKTLMATAFIITAMAGCSNPDDEVGPTGYLEVEPSSISMAVGQSTTIHAFATVSGFPGSATFQTSNATVATVDAQAGTVRCVSAGTATITVEVVHSGGTTKTVLVTCTPAPLIGVTPTTVPFTHSVGVTACPQPVGTIRITNLGSSAVTVTLSSSNPAITVGSTGGSIPVNGFIDVSVSFNCSVDSGFVGTVAIVASNGLVTDQKVVSVQATITH